MLTYHNDLTYITDNGEFREVAIYFLNEQAKRRESINPLTALSRSVILYTNGNKQYMRFLAPLALICFVFWLFSFYPLLSYFGIPYVIAQVGNVRDNNSNEAPVGLDTISNLSSKGASASNSNDTQFSNYTDSTYGIRIKYPTNWSIDFPQAMSSSHNETISSKDLKLVTQFSSPTRENVTISTGNLVDKSGNPISIEQFINNLTKNSRNAFAEYRLLDLRINSEPISNLTVETNNSDFNTSAGQVIYNLTYSGEKIEGDSRSHIRGMDVGAIVNGTAYDISFQATVESYSTYLPKVLEMIYSFEISDRNKTPAPKLSSSQATISAPPNSSSNQSDASREQNTVMSSETTNSPPSEPNVNVPPLTATQQASPSYTPAAPGGSLDPAYPTSQLYPPGYSPYPPPEYSPYAGYSPYADYLPYIVIDPVIPTTPVIPPVDFADPTLLSYNTYNDTAGVFHIVGEVENSSPSLITSVQVIAAFYDSLNQLLAVKSAYTTPSGISSGQIAFFDLTIPPGTIPVDRVSQWTLRLVWQ